MKIDNLEANVEPTPNVHSDTSSKKTKKPNGSAKPKADNLVTLADICKEARIDPRAARIKLRASKLKKPAGGSWQWPRGSAALKEARAIIKSAE